MILWLALGYFLIINLVGIWMMGQDKFSARTNTLESNRTPEGQLFFLAIVGGSLGVYLGMFLFRHKTKKAYFTIGLPILVIQQCLLLYTYLSTFLHFDM